MKTRTLLCALGLVACAVLFYPQTASAHGPSVVYRGNHVTVRVGPGYGLPCGYGPYVRYQPPIVVVAPPRRAYPLPVYHYAPAPYYHRSIPYRW